MMGAHRQSYAIVTKEKGWREAGPFLHLLAL
jgi:hypothetical protein